ncbi:hypothetical protein GOP47_0025686 [Adiantum capillus-veneris]|uniref:Mediator of RNA polymerase II transcription subunit 6 n=1 Tax=Adiantum capillus-veneris TaxID=13818 RepID=A0A9D4U1D5_ADICA|nr:hypothetical protein GOP47_0025686 [Adiantum capillus-veneris]
MAGVEGPPGTEMTGISFRDQVWLDTFRLERGIVFDYFALSPFYDRACNNEQLRMRCIHPLDVSHLSKMTGIEYMLYEVQEPNLYVFRKQKRESPEKVIAISGYYILDGSIYQAPNIHNVIGSRVVRALYYVSKAFSEATSKLEKVGYEHEAEGSKSEKKGADESKKQNEVFDLKEVFRADQILATVQRKLPPAPPPPLPMPGGGAGNPTVFNSANEGAQAQAAPLTAAMDGSTLGKQNSKAPAADQPAAKRVKTERS